MNNTKTQEYEIEVAGGHIYAKKWISETTTTESPLILLHDSLGSVDLWKDFPLVLAEKLSRPVVAYDRLGFGKSSSRDTLPSCDFIEEEAIEYFPALKETLSLNSYALFGHSVGGGMVINIAARDIDCEAVVTMSAQAFVEELTIKGIEEAKQFFAQPGQLERLQKWHGDKAKWVLDAWTEVWLSKAFANWSLQSCIGNVSCPVLAIHGENDEYGSLAFPEFISENTSGQSDMLVLKDCGHTPHKEKPEEVFKAVKQFLDKVI
ncbi:alpha/beta fold hydrolase [uncultured Cocleimonas sp.]|uniref:alpha/beta fold hydrolase n=1 Tax=uncultured Cocleimonas sp. TaxID=1051587 RepID=UPI00260C10E5|nr:alpha/beta hydrolase [uncultured Cocleimonas sp.]